MCFIYSALFLYPSPTFYHAAAYQIYKYTLAWLFALFLYNVTVDKRSIIIIEFYSFPCIPSIIVFFFITDSALPGFVLSSKEQVLANQNVFNVMYSSFMHGLHFRDSK